jgi:N-succinyldiaminopimelate aminotransferase
MTGPPPLSSRLQGFGTTIFATMSALAQQTGALNLGQGFPDTDGPAEVAEAARAAILDGYNQYPPGPGLPELRLAIAAHQKRFWDLAYDPDTEVLVTAGATEAITAALLALCEPGDEVVVFDPTYDSYQAAISMSHATMRGVLLRPDVDSGRYQFDPDELRRAFSPKTRLVLLNTPHNPTGKVFNAQELRLLADLCVEHDTVAVTDEVYEHLVFDGAHQPLVALPGMADRTLSVSSAGKTFSFTGWKIGWVTGPAPLVAAVRTAKQFMTYVNGGPFQPAVAVGLGLDDAYFAAFAATHRHKRDLLSQFVADAGFTVYPAEGTYFLTADSGPLGYRDALDFCLELPERAGVVAVPCSVFYQHAEAGRSLVRFCFAKQDDVLVEAGQRLVDAFS